MNDMTNYNLKKIKNKSENFYYKTEKKSSVLINLLLLFLLTFSFFISCAKYDTDTSLSHILIIYLSGSRVFQMADTPYSLSTVINNEKGAADLDGIGENSSFVYLSTIQYFNDTLYILDNTKRIYPKLKTLNPITKELITIGSLITNKPIVDMAMTKDGHFFMANDRVFYFSSLDEIAKGTPTKTTTFSNPSDDIINFLKLIVDSNKKYIYLLNKCKIYRYSYINLPTSITPSSAFYSYPNCTTTSNITINNFGLDENDNLYLCQSSYLQKVNTNGTLSTLFSNYIYDQYANLSCYLNKKEIFFLGKQNKINDFVIQYPVDRLYKINISTSKINLLAGGVASINNFDSKDGVGTFSGLAQVSKMTFDTDDNIYFIDNKSDYNSINQTLIQKIRKATKL